MKRIGPALLITLLPVAAMPAPAAVRGVEVAIRDGVTTKVTVER